MHQRLNQEIVSLISEHNALYEHDDGHDPIEARNLLRARLAATIAAGLGPDAGAPQDSAADEQHRAYIAAYLDGAVTQHERNTIARLLADDPTVRAEHRSAAILLEGIELNAIPPELLVRAVDAFASEPPAPRVATSQRWSGRWHGRSALWSGLAALIVVAAAIPVVSVMWYGQRAVEDDGPPVRGISPATHKEIPIARAAPDPRLKSCDDASDPVKAGQRPDAPRKAETINGRAAEQPIEAPVDDPCRSKPVQTQDGKAERSSVGNRN